MNRKDENNLKQGYWEIIDDSTSHFASGFYLNDKRHGYWKEDYSFGLWGGFYDHGKEEGVWRSLGGNNYSRNFYIDGENMWDKIYDIENMKLTYGIENHIDIHVEETYK